MICDCLTKHIYNHLLFSLSYLKYESLIFNQTNKILQPQMNQPNNEYPLRKKLQSKQLKTLIGIIVIKLGTGLVASWGNINLYFLSYFDLHNQKVSPKTNSYIFLAIIIPMCFLSLLANFISKRVGHQITVKVCAAIYLISPLALQILQLNLFNSIVFLMFLPVSAFAVSVIPLFNMLWQHYQTARNRVTALCIIFFSIGSIIWNLLFMQLVNPNNLPASVKGQSGLVLFDRQVAQNVPFSIFTVYLSSGLLFFVGSFLVTKKERKQGELLYPNIDKKSRFSQFLNSERQSILQVPSMNPKNLATALKDTRFLFILSIATLYGFYTTYLLTNLKIVYMPIVNDDHFLSYCNIALTGVSTAFAYGWGIIGDRYGFAPSLLIACSIDLLFKLYGNFADTKTSILAMFLLLAISDKAMLTLVGPGLIQLFGLQIGTELLPFKGISIYLGYALVPCMQIATASHLQPHGFLVMLSLFSFLVLGLAIRFYFILKKKH